MTPDGIRNLKESISTDSIAYTMAVDILATNHPDEWEMLLAESAKKVAEWKEELEIKKIAVRLRYAVTEKEERTEDTTTETKGKGEQAKSHKAKK